MATKKPAVESASPASDKKKALETAVDDLRRRFGSQLVRWGGLLTDLSLTGGNPSEEHTIHPAAFRP